MSKTTHARAVSAAQERRRRRTEASLPIFQAGFRPFFLMGSIWAATAIALWLGVLSGRLDQIGAMDPVAWHQHEMVFGFASAIIAGFVSDVPPSPSN